MNFKFVTLASAAVLVAGTAFAADLPAKKAAPAAAAKTGCPAFGAGYFQIPGSDDCIKFSGYVMENTGWVNGSGTTGYNMLGRAEFNVATAGNTELGSLTSLFRLRAQAIQGSTAAIATTYYLRRAYGQLGNFKFGLDDSHEDIWGVTGAGLVENFGENYSGTSDSTSKTPGMWYTQAFGPASLEVGAEGAVTDGKAGFSNRPDLAAKLTFSGGPAKVIVSAVSHAPVDYATGSAGNGYALLGNAIVTAGDFSASVYGGASQGAMYFTSYTSANSAFNGAQGTIPSAYADMNNGTYSKGFNYGSELKMAFGPDSVNYLAADAGQAQVSDSITTGQLTYNYADVSAQYALAKNMYVLPEIAVVSGAQTATAFWLGFRRDY